MEKRVLMLMLITVQCVSKILKSAILSESCHARWSKAVLPDFRVMLSMRHRHIFHSTCIDPWLLDHRTCPMCKLDVIKALGYWGEPEGGQTLPAAESGPGSVSAEMLSAAFPGEDRSIGSNLPSSSSSSSPSTSESGLQCTVTCAKDSGKHSIAR